MTDLAGQLREVIRRSGLNRKQVADQTGISYAAIHGFVGGTRDMRLSTASKVAELLGVELRPMRRKQKTSGKNRTT